MFNLHWVDIGTTHDDWLTASTWSSSYASNEEDIIRADVKHAEGQIPSLTLIVRNPKIGLLNASRPRWAWFSVLVSGVVHPLFFGRLVGIPTDMIGEAVTLEFTARSKYFVMNKQIAAEDLKVAPYYDPVFIDLNKRDNPDAILEGYSALWHTDRVSLAIRPSDILIGEDGTTTFLESDVPYGSVRVELGQSPLIAVAVDSSVTWNQEFTGYIDGGSGSIQTYSGDGIMGDWPKPGSQLADGWTVMSAFMKDVNRIATTQNVSFSSSWNNSDQKHKNGDVLSYNANRSYPNFRGGVSVVEREIMRIGITGLVDPNAVLAGVFDSKGNSVPSPINRPASLNWTKTIVPAWNLTYSLGLRYDALRSRTERIQFILKADAQPILSDALLSQDTDTININGADVSMPIVNFRNWSAIAGKRVDIGQFVFPDDPLVPGQKSIQVCVVAGVAGDVVPTFSNVAGVTTVDGSVTWSSLGAASGIFNISTDWQRFEVVPLGDIILPRVPFSLLYSDFIMPGRMQTPQVGISVPLYQIVEVSNVGFFQCILGGTTRVGGPHWNTSGAVVDGTVTWEFIGTALPTGVDFYVCTQQGETGISLPRFGDGTTTVIDGTVVWTKLPATEVPIGGAPGKIPRNDYFPTERGLRSLEYLLCLARARLRMRSRAITISFNCAFEKLIAMSCRMNATLYDRRLPGGVASGKVIEYSMTFDGNKKALFGTVKIGCSVGNSTPVTSTGGDPTYVSDGYASDGYQWRDGSNIVVGDDIGYTPPASNVTDKFTFPLTADQVFLNGGIVMRGNAKEQVAAINSALHSAWIAENYTPQLVNDVSKALLKNQLANQAAWNSVEINLQRNPIWLEFELLPVRGGQYENFYGIETSPLALPKTIDLSADATIPTPPAVGVTVYHAGATLHGVSGGHAVTQVPTGRAGAILSGGGSMVMDSGAVRGINPAVSGSGSMVAVANVIASAGAILIPNSGLSGDSFILPAGASFVALAGSGSMAVDTIIVTAAVRLKGAGRMAAFANAPVRGRGFLPGAGSLTASAYVLQSGKAALSGVGHIVFEDNIGLAGLAASGTLAVSARVRMRGSTALFGEGTMVAYGAGSVRSVSFTIGAPGAGANGFTVYFDGSAGGTTTFDYGGASLIANGGHGGYWNDATHPTATGGTASGGSYNTTGGDAPTGSGDFGSCSGGGLNGANGGWLYGINYYGADGGHAIDFHGLKDAVLLAGGTWNDTEVNGNTTSSYGGNNGGDAAGFGNGGGGASAWGGSGGKGKYGGGGAGAAGATDGPHNGGTGGSGFVVLRFTRPGGDTAVILDSGTTYDIPSDATAMKAWVGGAGGGGGATRATGGGGDDQQASGGGGAGGLSFYDFTL